MTKQTEFAPNVSLDAVLVHAAMLNIFEAAAIHLGMSTSDAFGRAEWLKNQPEEYIEAVVARVMAIIDQGAESAV